MDEKTSFKREDALDFLVKHSTGVLATVSENGTPRARTVYYTCDDSFNVYFLTLANTRKAHDLAQNARAAFVVSDVDMPRTLQLEGTIEDLTYSATIDPQIKRLLNALKSNETFGAPLARFDTGEIRFYRCTPTWIRWGDFTYGTNSDQVLTEVPAEE